MKNIKLIANEKGYTLIEMLVTIAIVGAITGVMSMAVIVIMKVNPQNNDWAVALQQVQNAGYWISRDTLMANTVTVDGDTATPLFLTMTSPVIGAADKTVIYELEDTADGMKKLTRTDQDTGAQILIAEFIYYDPDVDPANSTKVIDYQDPFLTVRITATAGSATVSRQYEGSQRVSAGSG